MSEQDQAMEQAAMERVAQNSWSEPELDKIIQDEDVPPQLEGAIMAINDADLDMLMASGYGLSIQQRIQRGKK